MKRLLGTFVLCLAVSDAVAADPVDEIAIAPDAPVFSWAGGYVGVQGGYASGRSTYDVLASDAFAPVDPDGWVGGAYAGYNWQLANRLVLGVEVDAMSSNVAGGEILWRGEFPIPESAKVELDWSASLRGRVGYGFDRFLPYASAGLSIGRYDHVFTSYWQSMIREFGDTYVGWTVGAGAEYAFTDNLIGRLEYRYTDFGGSDFPEGDVSAHSVDLDTHDVRAGLSFKF